MSASPHRQPSHDEGAATSDRDRAATLQLVIAIGRTLQTLEKAIRPHLATFELGTTEFAVLEVLHHKGPLPLSSIRDRILVTGASTTYLVDKLEQRGLVRRRTSPEDGRVVLGELTSAGRRLIERVFPGHVRHLRELTAGLSPSEKRTAAQLLRKLVRSTSTTDHP